MTQKTFRFFRQILMVLSVVLSIVLVFFLEVKAQQGVLPVRDNRPEKLEVNDSLFPETD
jgi:hypothetical protein